MLTDDKEITRPEYWNNIYRGKNDNAKVDASNTVRPVNPFDRFGWVAGYATGPKVLDIGSGHAHVCKRIKAAHNDWIVIASDQARNAKDVANFEPYVLINGYNIPYADKYFNTIIATQCLEYFDDQVRFLKEAQRVACYLLLTVPIGEMQKWSQLRIYTEENVRELLEPLGIIEHFERHDDLLMVKLLFRYAI